ncbi:hypothetical protein Rhopal_004659-T1 [Rhodotorula paludigena]|uniref:Major facilitator superfamily (MFS) profile domain-containing protein n=1 Tax=Rhodotorula paludigena TaxID=86838 RepID=A0AAV5GGA2_9BASI|nr:hypothetical protein Rhopal_004659-T1 [Rhodotorula paludigena]
MARQAVAALQDQTSNLSGGQLLIVFFGLQVALFLSFLDSTSVSTAAPEIGRALNASSSISWVGSSFLLANTAFQVVTSRLSDIFGRKLVLLGSLFLFVLGDLLCGFAKNGIWLYACRGVAGIGGGGINSLSMIIVSDVVNVRDRGKYQGLLGIAIALGRITPPIGVVTMLIIWLLLPLKHVTGDLKTKLRQMDWLGTFLALAMTICFLVPLAGGGSSFRWDGPVVIALFVVSGVLAGLFWFSQGWLAKLPLLPGRLFKNRNVALLLGQTFLVGIVYFGNIYQVPLYLQNVRGHSEIMSAALLLPLVLVQCFTTTLSGYVLKWTNRTKASFFVGFVFWFAGQAGQICFDRNTSIGVIVGVLLVQGMGIGATLQSTLVLAQVSGPSEDRAVVTGARNFARSLGGAIGLAVSNTLLNNVFLKDLPASIPASVRQQLQAEFVLSPSMSAEVQGQVLDAYMAGMRDVFIFFTPVVGVCLVVCFFIKDLPLTVPAAPQDAAVSSGESAEDEKDSPASDSPTLSASVRPVTPPLSGASSTTLADRVLEAEGEAGEGREGERAKKVESDRSPV